MPELQVEDAVDADSLIDEAILAYYKAEDAGATLDPSSWLDSYPVSLRPALQAFLLKHFAARRVWMTGPCDSPRTQASSVPLDLPAELVDHPLYEIVGELGRGGMGVVYLARQKRLDRLEVLKVMRQRLSTHPESRARFEREMTSAASLNNPHVVTAFGTPEAGDLLVFAMEYVDGLDLAKFVTEERGGRPLSVQNACLYARQTALGLQHAFEHGLVHRDIKPQNLILLRQERKHFVKITDFGLAKARREEGRSTALTGQDMMMGTPDYIAPEQIRDAASTDIRADIYSLGCTLYFLLTGAPPFKGTSRFEILQAHDSLEATPLDQVRKNVPASLAAIVQKMMAKDPARRFQKPSEVADALDPFVKAVVKYPVAGVPGQRMPESQETILASRATTIETPSKPSTAQAVPSDAKRRWVIGGAVTTCLVLLGLTSLWAGGIIKLKTKDGTIVLENLPPDASVLVDGENVTVTWDADRKKAEIKVRPGTRRIDAESNGIRVVGEEVVISDGGREIVTARLVSVAQAAREESKPDPRIEQKPLTAPKSKSPIPGDKPKNDETGMAKLNEVLKSHTWHYHDNLYPPGDVCQFYANGTFHTWKWKYWVVGPNTMRVHYDRNIQNKETGILFTFNQELTKFTAEYKDPNGRVHKITGTRQ